MAEPVSPIPTLQQFRKYRDTSNTPSPPTPPPRPPRTGRESSFTDDDDYNLGLEQRQGENCRDYHDEDLMVELLERRRVMFARSNSLHPSTVRISHAPSPPPADAISSGAGDGAKSAHRRRGRQSDKAAAAHDGRSVARRPHSNKNNNSVKGIITHIVTKPWSWLKSYWDLLFTEFSTLYDNMTGTGFFSLDNITTFFAKHEVTIIRWTLIGLGFFLVALIVPCIARDPFGTREPADSDSLLSFCNRLNLPGQPPVVGVLDPGSGRGRGVAGGGGSWRSSLRTRWSRTWIPTIFKSPTALLRLSTDILDPNQSDDEHNNDREETTREGLAQRMTGVERSLSSIKVDLRLIQEQLRSSQWVEDKVLHLIRDELPAELVLAKDPTTGKMVVPVEFWEGAEDFLIARGYLLESVRDELNRQRDNKWEDFLVENENRIKNLFLGNINNSAWRAVVSREEFLYLVATESNAIWTSIEGWIDSFVQRQLDQWKPEVVVQGGDNRRAKLSRAEQHVLAEMIDRALERHHHRHRHQGPLPSNDNGPFSTLPDYALYNSGGRIIPCLTTLDYHRYKPSTILGLFFRLQNWIPPPLPSGRERLANRAIQVGTQAGDCWPMQGSKGQLAIRLARRVDITAVTIEHVDPKVSLDFGSAPREIEIWRLVAPLTPPSPPSTFSFTFSAGRTQDKEQDDEGQGEGNEGEEQEGESPILATWHKYGSPLPGASLLTTITYQQPHSTYSGGGDGTNAVAGEGDGHDDRESRARPLITCGTAQTFSIPLSKQNAPAYGVLVRVLSNWGHPDFTCLYRVRVHGYEV